VSAFPEERGVEHPVLVLLLVAPLEFVHPLLPAAAPPLLPSFHEPLVYFHLQLACIQLEQVQRIGGRGRSLAGGKLYETKATRGLFESVQAHEEILDCPYT